MSNHKFLRKFTQRLAGLTVLMTLLGALVPMSASVLDLTSTDPTDAPAGPEGKTDFRSVSWNVTDTAATLTVSVDESKYGIGQRAELGVHVLLDTNREAPADLEVSAVRNADGTSVDFVPRL